MVWIGNLCLHLQSRNIPVSYTHLERDLREDQEYIFEQIIRLAKEQQPDAMVIAGDIYDKAVPSAEAVEIFDSFMKNLSEEMPQMPVMIISGNHDSAARLNCFRSILSRQNVYMIGTPPTTEEEHIEKVTLQDLSLIHISRT